METTITVSEIYELAKEQLDPNDIDTYNSDLYLRATPASQALVNRLENRSNMVKTFKNNIDGRLWYDIPFACMDKYIADRKARKA